MNGFSLPEVMIAAAVSALVIGGVLATLTLVNKGDTHQELLRARDEIINNIRFQSMNLDNLTKSAELTSSLGPVGIIPDYGPTSTLAFPDLLKNCLPNFSNTPSAGCDKKTFEESGKGFLFYLTGNAINDPENAIAGEDVYYRTTGQRCSSTDAANPQFCPLTARAWFEPNCLNFAETCNKAMSLIVRYSVGLRDDYVSEDVVPTLLGEFYVPLEKGVQIRNLLSQTNMPLFSNSKGIFVIPKFYGYTGQYIEGLRFEVTISNPEGLTSMRIQSRSLTGSDAKLYDDTKIPDELLNKSWSDVPTPENSGLGAWSIDLKDAGPNQTFNFGTQSTVASNSRTPVSYSIGKSKGGTPDPVYHWTLNSDSSDYIPPTFKSGFYQFRVLTKDSLGGEIESANYITVRLISIPEFQYVNSNFTITRDCIKTSNSYSIFVADDEAITFSQLKLNNVIMPTSSITGDKGLLNFDFLMNQSAGDYPVVLTLKNRFSDVAMETGTIAKVEDTKSILLTDVLVSSSILNNPEKIRYLSTGTVNLNYSAGNCCNATPKSVWSFLSSPDFGGVPLLAENSTGSSANYTSSMTCSVIDNLRTCSTSIVAKGLKESPPLSSPPYDISAQIDLGGESTNPACQFSSTKPSGDPIGKFIPVVNLPTIRFYLTESLWLHGIPAGPATSALSSTSIKPITPRVYVRIDFSPANNVEVFIVDSANPTNKLCSSPITFIADGGTTPIDKFCDLNSTSFSGTLELRRKDNLEATAFNKIAYEGEPTCPFAAGCDAQIAGTVHHTICQRNFTDPKKKIIDDTPMSAEYLVKANVDMLNSPYGLNNDGSQNIHNDNTVWKNGRKKQLRCYDNWMSGNWAPSTFNPPNNKQDYYDVFKYNNETRLAINPIPAPIQSRLESPTSNSYFSIAFSRFYFPINSGSYDYSADNIPFVYMISQASSHSSVNWSNVDPITNLRTTSGTQAWEDVTNGLNCSGLSNNIKLLRIRPNINWNTSTVTNVSYQALENFNYNLNDRYSYFFMCDYGRWHPSGQSYNTWTD